MERFKKWGWIIVVVLVIGLLVYFCPWSYKIDNKIQGVQCRIGDLDYSENVTILVKGIYRKYLLKNDTFSGTLSINKYGFTYEVPVIPTAFYDGYANLSYSDITDATPHLYTLGILCCSPNFDMMLIGVSEPIEANSKSWSGENGLFICAPAESRAQAVEIAQTLSSKSKWLSHTNWN